MATSDDAANDIRRGIERQLSIFDPLVRRPEPSRSPFVFGNGRKRTLAYRAKYSKRASSDVLSSRSIVDELIANWFRELRTSDGSLCHQVSPDAMVHCGSLAVGPHGGRLVLGGTER